jgi:hypothetical protein
MDAASEWQNTAILAREAPDSWINGRVSSYFAGKGRSFGGYLNKSAKKSIGTFLSIFTQSVSSIMVCSVTH